jgi:hypothetical protein
MGLYIMHFRCQDLLRNIRRRKLLMIIDTNDQTNEQCQMQLFSLTFSKSYDTLASSI